MVDERVSDRLDLRLVAVIEKESTHLEADEFTRAKLRQMLKATHFDAAVANVGSKPRPGYSFGRFVVSLRIATYIVRNHKAGTLTDEEALAAMQQLEEKLANEAK
jgi:hypothetical protein